MKGARAKKAAEEAAGPGDLQPTPPKEARDGPPRPGNGGDVVSIPADTFRKLLDQMRTNVLLGPAAADALEAAAGLRQGASPQGGPAKDLREKVADGRDDGKPKKKLGGFGAVEDIPDAPEERVGSKGRASIKEEQDAPEHDVENVANHPKKDAQEPPELNLNPKQNHLRTDLEMWFMDEIPPLFGVDDSEELEEDLQEDGQAYKITELIAQASPEEIKKDLEEWLGINGGPRQALGDVEAKQEFRDKVMGKIQKIQDLGPKKKKKKKPAE